MRIFPSRKEIRWWFRHRHSGRLNSLSYWLCVSFFSALLSLVFSALWQVQIERQAWLEKAAEYSDWVYSKFPKGLEAYSQFKTKYTDLKNQIAKGNAKQSQGKGPLIKAVDIEAKDPYPRGRVFDKPDIKIHPDYATFSKDDGPIDEEDPIFHNFAASISKLYNNQLNQPGSDPNHIERVLAAALGLTDPTTNKATFDVPWVFVASDRGAIAAFPGTDVITGKEWRTQSRPWFRAAFDLQTYLAFDGPYPFDGGQLTVTYLDVLARSPMLVRTYWTRFRPPNSKREFIICIDLKLRDRDEDVSGGTLEFFNRKPNYTTVFVNALLPKELHLTHYIIFGLVMLFFLILQRISSTQESRIVFKKRKSLLGKITLDAMAKTQVDEQEEEEWKWGIKIDGILPIEVSKGKTTTTTDADGTTAARSLSNLRGFETWGVSQDISDVWSLLGIKFESNKITYIGIIELIYSSDVLPAVKWSRFNKRAFSESEEAILCAKLSPILKQNAASGACVLDIPYNISESPTFLRPLDPPHWLNAVVDDRQLVAIHHGRAYINLGTDKLEELYLQSYVKAVMTSGYLEQLLNHGDTEFLFKGRTIFRIISFPNQNATLNLTETGHKKFEELLNRYSSISARSLKRVNIPINNDSLSQVYDFAIFNDSSVIVAQFISQATGIDHASGKQTKSNHYVEGYLSWREADIKFYHDLFEQMAKGELTELRLP
jgi:hypothetical protein